MSESLELAFREAYFEDDLETMKDLVAQDPGLLHTKVHHNDIAIHDLLRRSHPDPNEEIQWLLRLDPTQAKVRTGSTAESDEFIMENYGQGTQSILLGGPDGLLPIHLAAGNKAITLETFKQICQAFPEGVTSVDSDGVNPLHYVIFFHEEHDLVQHEKLSYLVFDCEKKEQLAAAQTECGNFPLHLAAAHDFVLPFVEQIYSLHPPAIYHRNKEGKLPLDLTLKNLPFSRKEVLMLRGEYDPYPGKHFWIDDFKSSFWVRQNYSETWVDRRLEFPVEDDSDDKDSDDEDSDDDEDSESGGESLEEDNEEDSVGGTDAVPERSSFQMKITCEENSSDDTCHGDRKVENEGKKESMEEPFSKKQKVSDHSPILPRDHESLVAEEAIKMSLVFLSTPKDLLAVSAVSKYLYSEVPKKDKIWAANLKRLDEGLPLQEKETAAFSTFPREFVDPRLCSAFKTLTNYEKCMFLGQYKCMVLEYIRSPMDEVDMAFMKELLERVRATVRRADDNGIFNREMELWDFGEADERAANVNESLARCTIENLQKYLVDETEQTFLLGGMKDNLILTVVAMRWESIDFGEDTGNYELLWSEVAGLVFHG